MAVGAHASAAVSSGGDPVTSGVDTRASGSTFVVLCVMDAGTFTSIADNKSNTYTLVGAGQNFNSSNSQIRQYRCENGTGGGSHTWTLTTSSAAASVFAVELTSMVTASVLDQQGEVEDTATPYLSTSETTTRDNETLVAGTGDTTSTAGATHSESTGYTIQEEVTDGSSFYTACLATRVVTSIGTYQASFTLGVASSSVAVQIGTYKGLVPAAPTNDYVSDQQLYEGALLW